MGRFILKDHYYQKAKAEGLRARSAFKLREIQKRFQIIKEGYNVLDLGCAPGSFLQVLSEMVGEQGSVIGIDILPCAPLLSKQNVQIIKEDIRALDVESLLKAQGISAFDMITCDIAPNLSGIREVDDRNIDKLYHAVREIVEMGLKKGGGLIFKAFFSERFKEIKKDLEGVFHKVMVFKPAASRSRSSETYLICISKI